MRDAERAADEVVGVGPGQLLAHDGLVDTSGLAGHANEVRRQGPGPAEAPPVAAATPASLEDEHRLGHGPALIEIADPVPVRDGDVVEEVLAELGGVVDLPDGADREPGGVARHREPGESAVLGDVPVCSGQAQSPVGEVRVGAPDLLTVEDPLVAVLGGRSPGPGEVRTRRRLGEELADERVTRQHLRDEAPEEFRRGVRQHGGDAHPEGRPGQHAEVGRDVAVRLLVEDRLERGRQPAAAVLLRPGDPGVAAVEEGALQGAVLPR